MGIQRGVANLVTMSSRPSPPARPPPLYVVSFLCVHVLRTGPGVLHGHDDQGEYVSAAVVDALSAAIAAP